MFILISTEACKNRVVAIGLVVEEKYLWKVVEKLI